MNNLAKIMDSIILPASAPTKQKKQTNKQTNKHTCKQIHWIRQPFLYFFSLKLNIIRC